MRARHGRSLNSYNDQGRAERLAVLDEQAAGHTCSGYCLGKGCLMFFPERLASIKPSDRVLEALAGWQPPTL